MSTPAIVDEPAPRPATAATQVGTDQSIRIAAVGDLHATSQSAGRFRPGLLRAAAEADVLLLAGDVTNNGRPEEARCVAEELRELGVPTAATLGNHDHQHGCPEEVAAILADAGVHILEGTSIVLTIGGIRSGIAGVKGFGGGFPRSGLVHEFGEPETKAFAAAGRRAAEALAAALAGLDADVRMVLTHYAPCRGTLAGEEPELFPLLGSHQLGEAIDNASPQPVLAIHGHAHHGRERGTTFDLVPVRNVARHVIQAPYRVYTITPGDSGWAVKEAQDAPRGRNVREGNR